MTDGGEQVTQTVFGTSTAVGDGVSSNDLAKETRYPDPSSGAASSTEKDTVEVNALGQAVEATDRTGTVHVFRH